MDSLNLKELKILDLLQKIRSPFWDKFFGFISRVGDLGIIWVIFDLVLLAVPGTRLMGAKIVIALGINAFLCNAIIKPNVKRQRPYTVNNKTDGIIYHSTDYSFPSGHTSAGFSFVCILFLGKIGIIAPILLIFSILMGISRMYYYMHYPSDIIAGAVLGTISGLMGCYIGEFLIGYELFSFLRV